ncbi:MAG: hypothetical protein AAFR66_08560 [Bacteroidota bacterium]
MKKFLLISSLAFFMACLVPTTSQAQVIVVKKPVRPKVVVVKKTCGPRNIWVDGHWTYNRRANKYVWVKGRCVKRKRGHRWVAGKWVKVPRGWKWVPGVWVRV